MIFQSLISGSSGCCFRVTEGDTTIFIDCGFKAMKRISSQGKHNRTPKQWCSLRDAIDQYNPVAVFASHIHQDHLPKVAPKLLDEMDVKLYRPDIDGEPLCVDLGEMLVIRRDATHDPSIRTYCFDVYGGGKHILVVPEGVPGLTYTCDFDFIYLEANHAKGILEQCKWNMDEQYYRRAGYHMANMAAATLLAGITGATGKACPVQIGNISEKHNTPDLAYSTIKPFYPGEITIAERYTASKEVEI